MELLELTELQKVLQDFATDIRDRYRDVLANNDHIASRKLVDSIKTQVVVGDNAYEVTMTLEDYWKYVEEDTPPHWPPRNANCLGVGILPSDPGLGITGLISIHFKMASGGGKCGLVSFSTYFQ